jgi:hypothetical protein
MSCPMGVIRRYCCETAGYGFASNPPYEAALGRCSYTIIASKTARRANQKRVAQVTCPALPEKIFRFAVR